MIAGLSTREFELLDLLLITPLKKEGASLWLFGSRARKDHKPFSDIDILFEPTKKIPDGLLFKLKDSLIESRLPYKVDLVQISDIASSYRDQILKEKIEL